MRRRGVARRRRIRPGAPCLDFETWAESHKRLGAPSFRGLIAKEPALSLSRGGMYTLCSPSLSLLVLAHYSFLVHKQVVGQFVVND